jgi:uncharacterized membrane protein
VNTTWWLQIIYAVLFTVHALVHLFPPAPLRRQMAEQNIPRMRLVSNVAELLGSAGLVLPAMLNVAEWLIPLAAFGLLLILLVATMFHGRRKELGPALFTLVLAGPLAWLIVRLISGV